MRILTAIMTRTSFLLLALLLGSGVAGAEEQPGELRTEMRKLFENRLRQSLALSDPQMEGILPRIERLEDARSQARRSRMETTRQLRMGLERGASDAELEDLLGRLERIERDQRELESTTMAEIDGLISTRQSVQLRFFMDRFRREMTRKIHQLRGDDPRGMDRPRRRGARRDRP